MARITTLSSAGMSKLGSKSSVEAEIPDDVVNAARLNFGIGITAYLHLPEACGLRAAKLRPRSRSTRREFWL